MTDHTFIGNVTGDPVVRTTSNDMTVTEFRIAVSDRYRDAKGAWVTTEAVFWPVQVWNDVAKAVADQVRAGAKVVVVGEIRNHEWTDQKTEEKKSRRVVQAQHVGLTLGSQPRSHATTQAPAVATSTAPAEVADPQWEEA